MLTKNEKKINVKTQHYQPPRLNTGQAVLYSIYDPGGMEG